MISHLSSSEHFLTENIQNNDLQPDLQPLMRQFKPIINQVISIQREILWEQEVPGSNPGTPTNK